MLALNIVSPSGSTWDSLDYVNMSLSLDGRVVALDLTIPLTTSCGFLHRFMGIYAPWNPGILEDENNQFWPTLTDLCLASNSSWSFAGDCNAALLSTDSLSDLHCTTGLCKLSQSDWQH
jgi:hypothetical protein